MKLSIITINYNNKLGLEKTIQSVVNQSWKEFEYIIVDGGSTDGSVDLINQYIDKVDYSISEKDTGIYNAMNKGIRVAGGEYFLFLNSGDWLEDNILEKIHHEFKEDDLIYGNWNLIYSKENQILEKFPDVVKFDFLAFQYSLPHQATFFKNTLFNLIGMYDENLRMVSDWKFYMLSIFKYHCSYRHIDFTISNFDKNGFSNNTANQELQAMERLLVMTEYFNNFLYMKSDIQTTSKKLYALEHSRLLKILKKMHLFKPGY